MSMDFQVDNLSYNALRKLAKKHGINAKQKAVALRSALRSICVEQKLTSADTEHQLKTLSTGCHLTSTSTPQSVPHVRERGEDNQTPAFNRFSQDAGSRCSYLTNNSKQGNETQLNTTYELESPKMILTSEESTKQPSGIPRTPSVPSKHQLSPVSQPASTTVTTGQSKASEKAFVARPVPNFSRIHARAASKMESLPQFMHRRQALRPPFASPPYPPSRSASGKSTLSTSRINRPLSDLSNHTSNPQPVGLTKHSSTRDRLEASRQQGTRSMSQSYKTNSKQPAPVIHKCTPKIPADSAFARRKAYDMKRNLARLSCHTPGRMSGTTTSTSGPIPTSSTKMKTLQSTTVPRRDPRDVRPGLSVGVQRERTAAVVNRARAQSRQALVDARRGL